LVDDVATDSHPEFAALYGPNVSGEGSPKKIGIVAPTSTPDTGNGVPWWPVRA